MATPGVTLIEDVVAPPGLQENVPPDIEGVAVSVAGVPLQTLALFTTTVGTGLTITVPVAVPGQPFKVYVTVYVVVVAGETFMDWPVLPPGDQE